MGLFGSVTEGLNPYLLYIKIAAAVLALCALIGAGLYVWHVFNDRSRLQAENGALSTKLEIQTAATVQVTAQFNKYIELNRDIAEAIRKVKVQSATYIESVEASTPPVVPDGGTLVLVPGGLPKAATIVPALSGFANRSTARTTSGPAPG